MKRENETQAGPELIGLVRREVAFTEGNAGIWDLTCPTCPLRVHSEALGEKHRVCAHGVITNIQGPVVMGTCNHQVKDSLVTE